MSRHALVKTIGRIFTRAKPEPPRPWTRERAEALLARLRAAESYLQDPMLRDAADALEWLLDRERSGVRLVRANGSGPRY